ncbi:hypothetical protein D043_2078B, partial [Vibrio parahaemolyticus EKP-021]
AGSGSISRIDATVMPA